MAEIIKMPKMSDTMTEGVIVSWLKKEGDAVKPGDILAEVETDKATMELENYVSGTLLHIGIKQGEAAPVDSVIAIVGQPGEDVQSLLKAEQKPSANPVSSPNAPASQPEVPAVDKLTEAQPVKTSGGTGDRLYVSPLARKMAEDRNIDLRMLSGSGDNGRIVKRDIENFKGTAAAARASASAHSESFTEVSVSQMRKTIARRLSESKFSAPHFYLTIEVRMDKALAARKQMNEFSPVKISVNDMIIKASALALKQHPAVNSSWLGDKIRFNEHVNVGVAIAVEDGLLVPVVRFADTKSLSMISEEVKEYAEKAKSKKLQPADWEGNTFSISNLGMFGVDEFTAIINPPDACIMAIGQSKETVLVDNGEMKIGQVMKVTLSCDHRVVDGATGAKFLQTFRALMEEPVKMLV